MSSAPLPARPRRSVQRWLRSTSNRTFLVWPIALLVLQALLDGGWPRLNPWGALLLAWGYGQYRWVGHWRSELGGGGPGVSIPSVRLVTTGPYAWTRNPMYLGHLIFFAGLALLLQSWLGLAIWVAHAIWFDHRVRADEASLLALFGPAYRDYLGRVPRWIPGVG